MLKQMFTRHTLIGAALLAGCAPSTSSRDKNDSAQAATVHARAMQTVAVWRADLDTLSTAVAVLDSTVQVLDTPEQIAQARSAFSTARLAFKHAEIGLEYYAPSTSREIMVSPSGVEENRRTRLAPGSSSGGLFGEAPAGVEPPSVRTLQRRSAVADMMAAQQATTIASGCREARVARIVAR
jgi:hypothetical protein